MDFTEIAIAVTAVWASGVIGVLVTKWVELHTLGQMEKKLKKIDERLSLVEGKVPD